jgi:predicted nucleic acid-binding protein
MANGLAVAERRGILSAADIDQSLFYIEQLLGQAIESEVDFVPFRQALATARTLVLSAYDATYLDTARRNGLPLATLDQRLRAAATRAGVELVR